MMKSKYLFKILTEEKLEQFESSIEAFQRYHRLNDYKKMFKAALMMKENKKINIELAAKIALKNNDVDFAWKAALYAGTLK